MIKKLFKKKQKFPTPTVPRSQDEIKKSYFEVRGQAGEIQYQVSILSQDLNTLNETLKGLNQEMHTRIQLDKASEPKAEAPVPAPAVQQ
jgi:hypothetical protein